MRKSSCSGVSFLIGEIKELELSVVIATSFTKTFLLQIDETPLPTFSNLVASPNPILTTENFSSLVIFLPN